AWVWVPYRPPEACPSEPAARSDGSSYSVRGQNSPALEADPPSVAGSRKLHDHRVYGKTVAGLGLDGLHRTVTFGAQHVLHFHGLDHGERFPRLDLLPLAPRDRNHK